MEMKRILTNPWVLGGGAIAAVVFFMIQNSDKGGTSAEPGVWNPNDGMSINTFSTVSNDAALTYAENMAQIASAEKLGFAQTRTTVALKALDAVQNMSGVFTTELGKLQEADAGVWNTQIQSATALAVDRNTNAVRRDMIYVAGDVSKFNTQAEGRVTIANNTLDLQAKMDKDMADASTENLGNLLGFTSKLATLAFGA